MRVIHTKRDALSVQVAIFDDGYDRSHRIICEFWEIVHALSIEQKKRLLFFCTGTIGSPLQRTPAMRAMPLDGPGRMLAQDPTACRSRVSAQ